MQNPSSLRKNNHNSKIIIDNVKTNQKYVNINILLNRVKKKNLEEKKKKVLLFCLASLSISITGLIIF
jgi:hypothetical protein